jgi:hemolysin activation/secretion protein
MRRKTVAWNSEERIEMRPFLLAAACVAATAAQAQVAIPPGLEPGQIQRQLQELRMPPSMSLQSLPPAPRQAVPEQAGELRFVLRAVHVEGASVYRNDQIARQFDAFVGKETNVAQVFELANAATTRYRRDGYILSQVLVPAQSIVDGEVRLVAVEGHLGTVTVRGEVPANDAVLSSYVRELTRTRPITAEVLERYLLLMNDLGNSTARGTLVPSQDAQGAADLLVDLERDRIDIAVATDSRNSRSLGPHRVTARLDWYDALSSWDHVGVQAGSSFDSELNYAGLSYGGAIGARGTQWVASLTGVRSRPGRAANLDTPELETESLAGTLQVRHPVLRSRTRNLYLIAAMASFDGQSELSFAGLSDDRIRTVRAGLSLDVADHWRGINMAEIEYTQGLDGLGARTTGTPDLPLSRAAGRADFSKLTLYAARLQSLGSRWSALVAVTVQQAFDSLLAPELFSFGGETFGRGYDAAELTGDSGEAAKIELRYTGVTSFGGGGTWSLYGFVDRGRIRQRDAGDREEATSAGLGLRFTSSRSRWRGFLELADPLDHDVASEGNRDPRVFFGLQFNP